MSVSLQVYDVTAGALIDGYTVTGTSSTLYTVPTSFDTVVFAGITNATAGYTIKGVNIVYTPLTAAAPLFSVVGGTYSDTQTVTITSATSGASIYYTTDGSTPTTSSSLYSTPVTISSSSTLKAIAVASGYADSDVTSATYTLQAADPTFSPAAGTYTSVQLVTISTTTSGAAIYYTTDGSTPTTSSSLYSSSVSIGANTTFKAIAHRAGMTDSSVVSSAYTINIASVVNAPTFSPAAGTYNSAQSITISSTTSGASIRYTTDGSDPTSTTGTLYSAPVTVGAGTTTLKAIAYAASLTDSAVIPATYTININAATPTFSPAAGTYTSVQSVTISTTTSGVSIRYTTDGSTPTSTTGTLYSGPISVGAGTTTLKAIAYGSPYQNSAVGSASYTVNLPSAPSSLSTLYSITAATGTNIVFNASASGSPAPTYQWQVSTNGGSTWANVTNTSPYSGATTNKLTITGVTSALSGNQYRFVATNTAGSANSNAATLTVAATQFPHPTSIAVDSSGNIYVGDDSANTVQIINTSNVVTVLAGSTGSTGSTDGFGSAALFRYPNGLVVDSTNSILYVADSGNSTIRTIIRDGVVTTIAGQSNKSDWQDGTGTNTWFNYPVGVALDGLNAVYVADSLNHVIRKLSTNSNTGIITVSTFAGGAKTSGPTDGTTSAARFNTPTGIVLEKSTSTVYIADTGNHTIRKIAGTTVSTLAGLATISGSADGTTTARFNQPSGLAIDSSGNIYVADTGNSLIRKVTSTGVVTTLAGVDGASGLTDGTGDTALFNQPKGVAVDSSGNVYVADTGNSAIRKITPAGVVTTLVVTAGATTTNSGITSGTGSSTSTLSTTPASGSGGGAPSDWFFAALAALVGVRLATRRGALKKGAAVILGLASLTGLRGATFVDVSAGISSMTSIDMTEVYLPTGVNYPAAVLKMERGPVFQLSPGFEMGKFKFSLDLSYSQNNVYSLGTAGAQAVKGKGNLTIFTGMPSVRYTLLKKNRLSWDVSTGVGVSNVQANGIGVNGSNYTTDAHNTNFGFKIGTAVDYTLSDTLSLRLGYNFVHSDKTKLETNNKTRLELKNIEQHQLLAGVTYKW